MKKIVLCLTMISVLAGQTVLAQTCAPFTEVMQVKTQQGLALTFCGKKVEKPSEWPKNSEDYIVDGSRYIPIKSKADIHMTDCIQFLNSIGYAVNKIIIDSAKK